MSVDIKIEENWKITSDRHGYQLRRFSGYDKEGEQKWDPLKFAGTIRSVLESWGEQVVRECDATTFKEIKQEIQKVRKRLDEIATNCAISSRETASAEETGA